MAGRQEKNEKSGVDNVVFTNDQKHRQPETAENATAKISKETSTIDPEAAKPSGTVRDTWDKPIEFLFSCISMSCGFGNIWRFPGVAARNGGGAFLIPYIIVVIFISRPLFYLEMCLGQFSRFGQVKIWNMAPMFKGVGYGSLIGVMSLCTYYVALMAIAVHFFINSFSKDLPWSKCHQDKLPSEWKCEDYVGQEAELYYNYSVLPQRENINDGLGKLHWQLVLCLIFCWILIFLCLIKGIKSSGKVAYVTAVLPYIVLTILLIRGVTLPGAWTGIKLFITPQWDQLKNPKVWYAAVEQCFFSLGAGFGPVIMFSSYNNFRQNIYRDALVVCCLDTFTSMLAGLTVFSVIGNLIEEGVLDSVKGGPTLAFILYPQAIAKSDWVPQLFAVLFFLMLFSIGVGSSPPMVGTVITIICDQFEHWKRWKVTLVVCVLGFVSGLLYLNEGGMFMLDLVDHYGSGFIIYVMAMIETSAICYVYGLRNICHDFEFMLGRSVGIYFKLCWAVIIPLGLLANLIYYLATEPEFSYNGVSYPPLVTICGWMLTAFAASMVPAWAIHSVATRKSPTLKGKIREALQPTWRWGPQELTLRKEWLDFRAEKDASVRKRFYIF